MNLINSRSAFIWYIFIIIFKLCSGLPTGGGGSRIFDDIGESATTRILDLNNPEIQESLLRQFNISADELRQHVRPGKATTANPPIPVDRKLSDIKELRYHDIRNKIQYAVHGNSMTNMDLPTHEMAAYPTCTHINESTWEHENNISIRFAASLFAIERPHMYLDKAVLRLYKINPNPEVPATTESSNCDENPIESQIRVTISTIQQMKRNKREKRKKICNIVMLNVSHTGWVQVDIKKAINLWERAERQTPNTNSNSNNNNRLSTMVGWLTIEVHDEDERQLKAGLYFEPPKCSEAYPAVPWNFYRQYFSWPSASLEKVPRFPRIDIKFIGYHGLPSTYRHTDTHTSTHHNHKINYRHNFNLQLPTTTTNANLFDISSEIREHRRRHEHFHNNNNNNNNNNNQHHHHHSERNQNSNNNDKTNSEDLV